MDIRPAEPDDLPAVLGIYNEVIATTTAVYREQPVTLEERAAWLADKRARNFPVLIAHRDGEPLGFGTFGDFRTLPCYRYTVEHTVHVRADARGQGIGRSLIEALTERARSMQIHMMVAGIDADNVASLRLHRKLGFTEAGVLHEVGRKFGRWLDLAFLQKRLT